jgi:hypothetical protein
VYKRQKETLFKRRENRYYAKLIDSFYNHTIEESIEFYHAIYIESESFFFPEFISVVCSSKDELSIPAVDFNKRLDLIEDYNFDEVCFLLGTYFRFPFIVHPNDQAILNYLPKSVLKIVKPTRGYLLFKEQAEELYALAANNSSLAMDWVEDWNKKKPCALKEIENLKIEDWPLSNIFKLFIKDDMCPFFMNKPSKETYILLKELNPEYYEDITLKGSYSCRFHGNEMQDDDTINSERVKEWDANIISNKRGEYKLSLYLNFPSLKFTETIEIGLNHEYVSNRLIRFHTIDIIHVSESMFLLCVDFYKYSPINSGHDCFTIYAKFESTLPQEIIQNNKIYKVF